MSAVREAFARVYASDRSRLGPPRRRRRPAIHSARGRGPRAALAVTVSVDHDAAVASPEDGACPRRRDRA